MSDTTGEPDIAVPARAMGDPARARILVALLGGVRLPAGELARIAGVGRPAASEHLRVLLDSGLVEVEKRGRHRYYRLADPDVARAVEILQSIAPRVPVVSLRQRRIADDLTAGRTCYDHLAGGLGLRLKDLLLRDGIVPELGADRVSGPPQPFPESGVSRVLGLRPAAGSRRPWVRSCLDWTARVPHCAGQVGAQVLDAVRELGWVVDRPGSRAVRLSDAGERGLAALEAGG